MAVSTTEVVLVLILGVVLVIMIWLYFTSHKHRQFVSTQSYTRGANLAGPGNVSLGCDADSEICVYSAAQICTNPDANNFEASSLDAMTSTGNLESNNIANLTDMAEQCNGQTNCVYNFTGNASFPSGASCNGQKHLIATYTCVAKGTCPPIQLPSN